MTAAVATGFAPVKRAKANKWLITVSISFGTLMGAVDLSIVNVALPHMRGAVGASIREISWISTAYAVALVIVMPLTAFLGRQFGQKRVYMLCLVAFLVGSTLCGLAGSLTTLVICRALQGFGAGALQPTEQAILRQTFPPEEQGMAMALFAMAVMLGPALGPTLGGYIVDHWHWSWIFFINVPIGLLGLIMVGAFVQEDEEIRAANQELAERQRKNMDWAGIILLSVGLTATEYFLEEGASNDWFESRLIAACFAVGFGSLIAFVVRELSAPAPVVNLRLFKDPVFASGTVIGGVMFAMLMASMFLLPIFMQELLGFTATQSGVALMPRMLVMMLCMPIVGRIYNRVSPRLMIAFGIALIALGSWQMAGLTLQSSSNDIIASIAVQGVGFACLFVPLTTVALSNIPRHLMADATGLNSLIRQVGGAVGLAIFATLLGSYSTNARAGLAAHLSPTNPLVANRFDAMQRALMRSGADFAHAHETALRALSGRVTGQAMVLAFDKLFWLSGVLFLGVLPLLFFLKGGPRVKAAAPALEH